MSDGIEINQLSEDRWSVRLTDLDRVPTVDVVTGADEHGQPVTTSERDWSNADWPGDEEIARAIGCPVRFIDVGDGLDEAIYERAEPAE